jgi:hypothetical protein
MSESTCTTTLNRPSNLSKKRDGATANLARADQSPHRERSKSTKASI